MNQEQIKEHLRHLSNTWPMPQEHILYLDRMKNEFNIKPSIIYDIGACVLHWSSEAHKIWPDAKIYAFEAMDSVEFLYKEKNIEYCIGVFSDVDNKEVTFYQNDISPGGNSYYKENSWATDIYYNKDSEKLLKTITIDTAVNNKNFPYPDLIKIDVQGCEIDILKGMSKTLFYCKHLIIELQHSQYNTGAPLNTESVPFIESLGFELITPLFVNNGPDGDYHFINKRFI
jgi:FkbM family methyltransferase